MKSAKGGKPDKKAVCSPCCGDEVATYYDGVFIMAVLSPQDGETADVFSCFSADGLYTQAFYWVIPLGFQKIKHQPFP